MRLRPYQLAAVQFLHARQRGFVVAPAGSGKTVIAAEAAADVARTFDRVAWVANTREQCEQARAACARASWCELVEIEVHCAAARPDLSTADIVIIDECHHLPAATWFAAAQRAPRVVWGFSATPWHKDQERNDCLVGFFGETNFHVVPREEVRAGGHLAEGRVVFHDLDTPGEFDPAILDQAAAELEAQMARHRLADPVELAKRARWRFTAEAIRANSRRNSRIVELAAAGDGVLVLVGTVEHGEQLAEQINGAVVVHAKLAKRKRAAAIDGFRSGEIRCLVATSLADEGLDVPRASVLVMAAGGRSAGKIEQRAGRVLRPFEGKAFGLVHDFRDRGSAMGHAQARARERVYRSLNYSIATATQQEQQT